MDTKTLLAELDEDIRRRLVTLQRMAEARQALATAWSYDLPVDDELARAIQLLTGERTESDEQGAGKKNRTHAREDLPPGGLADRILESLERGGPMNTPTLAPLVKADPGSVRRELLVLLQKRLIVKRGSGRGTAYAVRS